MAQPKVTIAQGSLRGSTAKDFRGNTFFKFQGIPYAKPPLGELRFKAPQPPENWSGIFDATKEGETCIYRNLFKNGEIQRGGEDCLVLNVFTKNLPKDAENLRPVLFWIHGGGFVDGCGNEEFYGPDFLITEDVVVVTINYRIGLLGFINFDDPALDVSGNAGLKDQVMALKWVQKNISKFGGDPNNVTIFGESAGGSSVHLLVLSPMAKGLFHKAIAQSGCALNPWALGTNGSKVVAAAMNLEGADEKTIYDALLKKSVDEIIEIQDKTSDNFVASKHRYMGVVVEKNSKEPFLDKDPIDIMLSGKFNQVPFMIGYNSREGMCFELDEIPKQPDIVYEDAIPWSFGYEKGTPQSQAVADKIKKFYFGNEEYSEKNCVKKYDMLTDCNFLFGIYVTVMAHIQKSKTPIYFYKMTVETELNLLKKILNLTVPGVSHFDDVGYLFKTFATPEIKSGSVEETSMTKFLKLWTNFAKFGNPTPDKNDDLLKAVWKPVTGANLEYLDIGKDLVDKKKPDFERTNFWKSLWLESPTGGKASTSYLK